MGGAAWKQLRLIQNGWEKVGLQPVLLTICSREAQRRIQNKLLCTPSEGYGMSNTPRRLPSSKPEAPRGPKTKKGCWDLGVDH